MCIFLPIKSSRCVLYSNIFEQSFFKRCLTSILIALTPLSLHYLFHLVNGHGGIGNDPLLDDDDDDDVDDIDEDSVSSQSCVSQESIQGL